jgi:hypothetical protein
VRQLRTYTPTEASVIILVIEGQGWSFGSKHTVRPGSSRTTAFILLARHSQWAVDGPGPSGEMGCRDKTGVEAGHLQARTS